MEAVKVTRFLLAMIVFMSLNCGCTAPQYFWPQEDMLLQEINAPTLERKILIASRQSEFKSAVVQRINDAFRDQAVYIKTVGIDQLKNEDANHYSAVLLINTSMGWTADRKVESFLDKYGVKDTIIVLTTSAGGDVLPETKDRRIDAISSASKKDKILPVAESIIRKINAIIFR